MGNNIVKVEELKQVLADLINRPDANNYLETQHFIVEAVGMLRNAEFDKSRLANVDGAFINILDVERYNTIMKTINDSIIATNNRNI